VAIGVIVWDLEITGAQSLKEKRSALKSLKDRLRERFQVAVAETDQHDLWQRAELTACTVSGERRQAERVLQTLDNFVAGDGRVRVIDTYRTFF
jgi:hypothetical protein